MDGPAYDAISSAMMEALDSSRSALQLSLGSFYSLWRDLCTPSESRRRALEFPTRALAVGESRRDV